MGSGTSFIEAQRMDRNFIGTELQKTVAEESYKHILIEKRTVAKPLCILVTVVH
ncbi:MAG: site-specific DNA-methyltransferase [Firmicutes bacterium]|nr:site-specific DNA-methyltransferase [Bacillota bacterium]